MSTIQKKGIKFIGIECNIKCKFFIHSMYNTDDDCELFECKIANKLRCQQCLESEIIKGD